MVSMSPEIRFDVRDLTSRKALWLSTAAGVSGAVGVIVTLIQRDAGPLPFLVAALIGIAVLTVSVASRRRPHIVAITSVGIQLPYKQLITWNEVNAVIEADGSKPICLLLTGGKVCGVPLPVVYAEQVASIGLVPLQRRPSR